MKQGPLFTHWLGMQIIKIYGNIYVDKSNGMISFILTIRLEAKFVLRIDSVIASS